MLKSIKLYLIASKKRPLGGAIICFRSVKIYQSHSSPLTSSISIPFVSWHFLTRVIKPAIKPGTSKQNAKIPTIVLPKIAVKGRLIPYEITTPIQVTINCADIVDERRFVGLDSPIIIIITSFVV